MVPVIKTARPFYGARVGDLRGTAGRWLRGHRDASPAEVAELADRLWNAGIREEQLVACFLLAGDPAALAATDPGRVGWTWTALLDNWETTDQLGMNVLGPLVALDPGRRFGLLQAHGRRPPPLDPAARPGRLHPPGPDRRRRRAVAARSPSCCWPWPPTARRPCPRPARGCCAAGWSPARSEVAAFVDANPGPAARPGRQGDQGQAGHRIQAAPDGPPAAAPAGRP